MGGLDNHHIFAGETLLWETQISVPFSIELHRISGAARKIKQNFPHLGIFLCFSVLQHRRPFQTEIWIIVLTWRVSGHFLLDIAGHLIKVFKRQDIVFRCDVETFAYLYEVRMAIHKSHAVVTGLNVPLLDVWR